MTNHLDPFDPDFFRQTPVPELPWICAHEAGHATAAIILNVPVRHAWVDPDDERDPGLVQYGGRPPHFDAVRPLLSAAGAAGEQLLLGYHHNTFCPPHLARYHTNVQAVFDGHADARPGSDLASLLAAAPGVSRSQSLTFWIDAAAKLLRPHASQLESIARRLAMRRFLPGSEIYQLWSRPSLTNTTR